MKHTVMSAALATVLSVSGAAAATPMRCSHQLPPSHAIAQVVDRWAAEVETLSNNEIDVQILGQTVWSAPRKTSSPRPKVMSNARFRYSFSGVRRFRS
ncbi:hypothetical protein COL8621_03616 [Actibacterium lipolyticum]|uniref:Uncharacterized protein n=1 Tax=Actibacterium lipolyticum TaxID=1524263 RepID=A0A238L9W2_9RHOB|nr:hypothetical protein COL8621_03616 [Actibacterium lipolyticum]